MIESTKNGRGKALYDQRKKAADAKKAAEPKPETVEQKEAVASKFFNRCTAKQWKAIKKTFEAVEKLVQEHGISHTPNSFNSLTQDECRFSTSQSHDDLYSGIHTFRMVYSTADQGRIYFPIVTSNYNEFTLLKDRTLSAQHNPLLTNIGNVKSSTENQEVDQEDNTTVETNEEQEKVYEQEEVNDQENADLQEQPVDYSAELEKMAAIATNGKSVLHPEENTKESDETDETDETLAELKRLATIAENGGYIYPLDENYNNHINKHDTHHEDNTFEHLHNHEKKDINDHIDPTNEEQNNKRRPLLGEDDHDTKLLKEENEDNEDPEAMEKMASFINAFDYESPANKPTHTAEEPSTSHHNADNQNNYLHNTEMENFDFFDQKNKHHNQQRHAKNLDHDATEDATPESSHVTPRLGGWSTRQECSEEEKHNTIAYVSKMTLSGKILGLLPTTQNIMSCAHQIVAGTNFSVVIQINNDICEVVYNVDLENIVHDLNKSYAQTEVPCVDMYARHLF